MNTSPIKHPHFAEKAVSLQAAGRYVFIVKPSATKNEIKKAVKELYHVDARTVRIVNLPGHPRRFRNVKRLKPGIKKAVVTLRAGQKIDLGR